jgi:hypothetical protein
MESPLMEFSKLDIKLNVTPLRKAIEDHPELFDQFTFRKSDPGSPHTEMQDIIFRYNPRENYHGNREEFNGPHDAEWYEAASVIPEVKDIVFPIMEEVKGERLGMVLCTKLPPGGEIKPHVDGGWHAEYYKKYYVSVKNKPGAVFYFENGSIDPDEGEVYEFNNAKPHWVENKSKEDRIALIVCIRGDN